MAKFLRYVLSHSVYKDHVSSLSKEKQQLKTTILLCNSRFHHHKTLKMRTNRTWTFLSPPVIHHHDMTTTFRPSAIHPPTAPQITRSQPRRPQRLVWLQIPTQSAVISGQISKLGHIWASSAAWTDPAWCRIPAGLRPTYGVYSDVPRMAERTHRCLGDV